MNHGSPDYFGLVDQVTSMVTAVVPPSKTVLVVSKGDENLLRLGSRTGWHFPRNDDGRYAGHYPADSADAIQQLEALRERGAGYVVFPATSLWWLDHYPELGRHLRDRYTCLVRDDDACAIYDLTEAHAWPPSLPQPNGSMAPAPSVAAPPRPPDRRSMQLTAFLDNLLPGACECAGGGLAGGAASRRDGGAEFLVIPREARLTRDNPELVDDLERRYRCIARQAYLCSVYDLTQARANGREKAAPAQKSGSGDACCDSSGEAERMQKTKVLYVLHNHPALFPGGAEAYALELYESPARLARLRAAARRAHRSQRRLLARVTSGRAVQRRGRRPEPVLPLHADGRLRLLHDDVPRQAPLHAVHRRLHPRAQARHRALPAHALHRVRPRVGGPADAAGRADLLHAARVHPDLPSRRPDVPDQRRAVHACVAAALQRVLPGDPAAGLLPARAVHQAAPRQRRHVPRAQPVPARALCRLGHPARPHPVRGLRPHPGRGSRRRRCRPRTAPATASASSASSTTSRASTSCWRPWSCSAGAAWTRTCGCTAPTSSCSRRSSRTTSRALLAKIQQGANNVTLAGKYTHDDLPRLMAEIDWVVVPSRWWENSPLVIQEAFLHQRPGDLQQHRRHGGEGDRRRRRPALPRGRPAQPRAGARARRRQARPCGSRCAPGSRACTTCRPTSPVCAPCIESSSTAAGRARGSWPHDARASCTPCGWAIARSCSPAPSRTASASRPATPSSRRPPSPTTGRRRGPRDRGPPSAGRQRRAVRRCHGRPVGGACPRARAGRRSAPGADAQRAERP